MNVSLQTGFLMFRIVIPLLILTIQFLLYKKCRRWLTTRYPDRKAFHRTATVLFAVFNLAFVFIAIRRPPLLNTPDWFLYGCAYPFFIWHGATFFIGLILFITWLIKLPFRALFGVSRLLPFFRKRIEGLRTRESYRSFDSSRRVFLRRSVYGLSAVSFGGSAYGLILAKNSHELTHVEFPISNLDPKLDGFTIGLISDIHSSVFMTKKEMDRYVNAVNELGTDMIVVPGDFVNSMVDEVYPFAEAFSNLRAPHGVYGVTGNHDYYNANPDLVAREVDNCGVKLLHNDKVIIEKDGGRFYLLGIDDVGRPALAEKAIDEALGQAPISVPRILLCHRPYFLQEAASRSIDLMLSGHTHGGQVVLAQFGDVFIAPAALASKYVWGRYRLDNTHMYVSRGIGTVALPIRINCPPEITRITLKRA